MRMRKLLSLLALSLVVTALCGISYGADMSNFIEDYYGALERSVSDGNLENLSPFLDVDTDYGRETLSWIVRLNRMDATVRFDRLSVGRVVEKDGETGLPVEDVMTITYSDERTKTFSYRRVYSLVNGKIAEERSSFDRIFPVLDGESAEKQVPVISSGKLESRKAAVVPESAIPESFLPASEEDQVSFFIRWNAPIGLFKELAGNSVSEKEMDEIADQMPPVAEGAMVLTVKSDEIASVYGAFRSLEDVDPSDAMRLTVSRMADDEEVVLKPFDEELGKELIPLSIVEFPDDDDMPRLYSALWKQDRKTVLIALSGKGLREMIDVASGHGKTVDASCRFEGSPQILMKAFVSNELLRSEMDDEMALYSKDPLDFEVALLGGTEEISLKWFTNAMDLFVDPTVGGALLPIGKDIPLLGDRILGFLSARLARIDRDRLFASLGSSLSSGDMEEFDRGMEQLYEATGLEVGDLLDLLGGRISLVLGARSRSPIGDVPGLFLLMEPEKSDVLAKVAEALPRIYAMAPPVGLKELDLDGWSKAYGMNGMVSATVAVGDRRLVLGAVDYERIGLPGKIPAVLAPILDEGNLAVMAISVADLREAVKDIVDANSIFLQDDDIRKGIEAFMEGSSHISSLVMRVSSKREGSISVKLIK